MHFPVFLGHEGSPNGSPAVTLVAEILNDLPDLFERHGICRFLCRASGHRAGIGVDASVGSQVEMWVGELPIEIVYRSSSFAAILKHTKDVFGCSHISCSYLREMVETVPVPLRHVLSFPQLGHEVDRQRGTDAVPTCLAGQVVS